MTDTTVAAGGRSTRRRWLMAAASAVLVVAAYAAVHAEGSRRRATMQAAAAAAGAAIRDARAADALTWAPDELNVSETTARGALVAQRAEETRLWPIPASARIVDSYGEAERTARRAVDLSRSRLRSARLLTAAAIRVAADDVAASEQLLQSIRLDGDRRSLLVQAQLALVEARVYEREGDLTRAAVRADDARELAGQVRDHAAAVAARYADAETLARWRRWKDETIGWSRREGRAAIVVAKEAHRLTLFVSGQPVRTYKVDLGFNWIADKVRAGDDATPEGRYHVIGRRSSGPFYKSLMLDYPNAEDRAEFSRARRNGALPPSAGIGSAIEIHGEGGRGRDWTHGCVAVMNTDMDDLFARVGIGTPVTIVGSDDFGAIAEFASQQQREGRAGRSR